MTRPAEHETYDLAKCAVFGATAGEFGLLSNMAAGFPLRVNDLIVPSAEALYQACRYPHGAALQREILAQKTAMAAHLKSHKHRVQSRPDWDAVQLRIMRWVLRLKLAQHREPFGALLLATGDRPIVNESRNSYWGARRHADGTLDGTNMLGRLLLELRAILRGPDAHTLGSVPPPNLPRFLLLGREVAPFQALAAADAADPSPVPNHVSRFTYQASRITRHGDNYMPDTARYPKRLIEVDLPIKRISAHARREKSIRHGHISTLHIWWARRPLAACRAVICAALWPDPGDPLTPDSFRETARALMLRWAGDNVGLMSAESYSRFGKIEKTPALLDDDAALRQALLDFIADFANWDNATNPAYLETSRALTQAAHEALGGEPGTRPLVVDPFAGGGAIPLEALRVGADAFASDLNPVAVLLNKVVLEYIPKYGQRLADEVRKWGQWVKEQAEKELAQFYPQDPDGATPISYVYARTITCEGPGCGANVPLLHSLWLAKSGKRSVGLQLVPNTATKYIDFKLVQNAMAKDIGEGTSRKGSVICPVCGYTTPVTSIRKQMSTRRGGTDDARLYAIVVSRPNQVGRFYRLPTDRDLAMIKAATQELHIRKQNHRGELSLVPDEQFTGLEPRRVPLPIYGMTGFGDLFTSRQALVLTTFATKVQQVEIDLRKANSIEFAVAIQTCLALTVDRLADKLSSLARWDTSRENAQGTFGRQALPMVWDFDEPNPFSGSGGDWDTALSWVLRVIEQEAIAPKGEGRVERVSATANPLPNDSVQAFVTDPPYYYSVPYSDLSDYFYVWLRRSLSKAHPGLLGTKVTPKDEECVQNLPHSAVASLQKSRQFYEQCVGKALAEGRRVTSPGGVGIVVFAHTETQAWESLLGALISAGWQVTASWPIDTEMGSRVLANRQSTLASSIHLACRPRETAAGMLRIETGDWRDVLAELPLRIHDWMPRLRDEGIVGADAIFACLGPALEIFSRYSSVEKASGEQVTLKEYLEQVWAAVSREALNMIFAGADATGFEADARLTAMWLWTLAAGVAADADAAGGDEEDETVEDEEEGAAARPTAGGYTLEYDAARKIAQGLGAHLEKMGTLVLVKGDKARLLSVAERAKALVGQEAHAAPPTAKKAGVQLALWDTPETQESHVAGWGEFGAPAPGETTLDRLHQAMLLFAAGRGEALKRFLVEQGAGGDQRFWRLADAFSALYPKQSDEKRWVDGVLARKKGLGF